MRHLTDNLTWKNPGQVDADIWNYLGRALLETTVCVMVQDSSSHYRFIANLPDCWDQPVSDRPSDSYLFGGEIGIRLEAVEKDVSARRRPATTEIQCDDRIFKVTVQPVRQPDGTVDLMSTMIEMTDEKRREKVLKALLREVSHRSKNLLAIIQSIASQTARNSNSLPAFLAKFTGRLFSLAQSQDLVTDSSWRGAFFADLARAQLVKYTPPNSAPIAIRGENVHLSPNAALHVGLAIHELAVNSASYGALSRGSTALELESKRAFWRDAESIEIVWTEDSGPDTRELGDNDEDKRHFGSVVLERVVPLAVGGMSEYDIGRSGVSYRLVFPIGSEETEK